MSLTIRLNFNLNPTRDWWIMLNGEPEERTTASERFASCRQLGLEANALWSKRTKMPWPFAVYLANQQASNRPDLVARVVSLKKNEVIDDTVKRKIHGEVIEKIHVIEFQKHSLPHRHMLLSIKTDNLPMYNPNKWLRKFVQKYLAKIIIRDLTTL